MIEQRTIQVVDRTGKYCVTNQVMFVGKRGTENKRSREYIEIGEKYVEEKRKNTLKRKQYWKIVSSLT